MYKIKSESLNAILQYLGKQPYAEVAQLIMLIQQCEQIKEEAPKEDEDND